MMKYEQLTVKELKKTIPVFGYEYEDVIDYPERVSIAIKDLKQTVPEMFEEPMEEIDRSFYEMVIAETGIFDHIIGLKKEFPYCDVTIISGDSVTESFDSHHVYIHNILDTSITSTTSVPEHLQ